jgi:hypothetical protein
LKTAVTEPTTFPDLLITAFDYDRQRAVFFRSNAGSAAASDPRVPCPTLAEALHASSNAPVLYFDRPAQFISPAFFGKRYWDGATAGLNNPVLAAVIEAIANGCTVDKIKVLTLGTASDFQPLEGAKVRPPLAKPTANAGAITALRTLAHTITSDPPDAATYEVFRILHGGGTIDNAQLRIVRMNPLIQPVPADDVGRWKLPAGLNSSEFKQLADMDMDATENAEVNLIDKFAGLWLKPSTLDEIPNQPIQYLDSLQTKYGHSRSSQAHARALSLGLCAR